MRFIKENQPTFSLITRCFDGKNKLLLAENKTETVVDNRIGKK